MSFPLRPSLTGVCCLAIVALASGCGKSAGPKPDSVPSSDHAYLDLDDITPAERDALLAAEPLALAFAARDYGTAFDQLAPAAKARLSLNQFAPDADDAAFNRHEQQPERDVTRERFAVLMQRTEAALGRPAELLQLHVHTSNPATLSGEPRTGIDGFETMLAVGNMPTTIPAAARRASIRGQLRVELSDAQLAGLAAEAGVTVAELRRDPDFAPYLNFKLVMIDTGGALRVGYFEFLPPSMLD